jgi:hypothetical protein
MKEITPIENKNLPDVKEAPPGIARTEQEAWRNILGTRVEVMPLPDYITPEVKTNLEKLGFGEIISMPKLDLKSLAYLKEVGIDRYLNELDNKYPKWKEGVIDTSPIYYTAFGGSQELYNQPRFKDRTRDEINYWYDVYYENVPFPSLPECIAVETVIKPDFTSLWPPKTQNQYPETPFAQKIELPGDRRKKTFNVVDQAIRTKKKNILEELGLADKPADVRQLEVFEYMLLRTRLDLGKNSLVEEWTNTPNRSNSNYDLNARGLDQTMTSRYCARGDEDGQIYSRHPETEDWNIGWRAAVVLGS